MKESSLWVLAHYHRRGPFLPQGSFLSKVYGKPKVAGEFNTFCCVRKKGKYFHPTIKAKIASDTVKQAGKT